MRCSPPRPRRTSTLSSSSTPARCLYFDRYDEYVPEELVRKGFAEGVLDIEGMRQRVLSWRDNA